jgi:hypothetical protein
MTKPDLIAAEMADELRLSRALSKQPVRRCSRLQTCDPPADFYGVGKSDLLRSSQSQTISELAPIGEMVMARLKLSSAFFPEQTNQVEF